MVGGSHAARGSSREAPGLAARGRGAGDERLGRGGDGGGERGERGGIVRRGRLVRRAEPVVERHGQRARAGTTRCGRARAGGAAGAAGPLRRWRSAPPARPPAPRSVRTLGAPANRSRPAGPYSSRAPPGKTSTDSPPASAASAASSVASMAPTWRRTQASPGSRCSDVPRFSMGRNGTRPESQNDTSASSIVSKYSQVRGCFAT